MTRILLRSIIPVLLCVLGLTQAQADPERQIRVELELGDSYTVALGDEPRPKPSNWLKAGEVEVLKKNVLQLRQIERDEK